MLANWDQQQLPGLLKLGNLTVISVDQMLITTLAEQLERSINWSVTTSSGTLYLTAGDMTYESAIQVKAGKI
jgi:uncharacterized protein YaeQ